MHFLELFLIAIGLNFDSFAVSISTGLTVRHINFWQAVRIAVVLAFFQAGMPLLGWLGGIQIARLMSNYDHWIAFGLLAALGTKMILETSKEPEERKYNPLLSAVLLSMAVATSIDALVVGISLAFVSESIYPAVLIIGAVTFLVSMFGMLLGKKATGKFGKRAEIAGGVILIGIGLNILLSHVL